MFNEGQQVLVELNGNMLMAEILEIDSDLAEIRLIGEYVEDSHTITVNTDSLEIL